MYSARVVRFVRGGRRGVLGLGAVLLFAFVGPARSGEERPDSPIEYRGSLLVQLRVSNLDRAVAFYTKVLGLDLVLRSDELHWAELSFGLPNVKIGLGEGEEVKGSGTTSLNVGVKDVDAARATLERRGVTFLRDTMTIEGKVKLADFLDPDGNKIRLAQSLTAAP